MKYKETIKECPLVSVIIPTYKRPGMLARAIDSVLKQSYRNIEVIVVDDNNQDSSYRKETESFMQKYRDNDRVVYLKHKKNRNGAAARNTGIFHSSAKYISFLDDDDEILPEKIELQVRKLENLDKSWGAVYCDFAYISKGKKLKKINNNLEGCLMKQLLLKEISISSSTLLVRKEVLNEINGFDETFVRHQDWELLIRIFRKYKIALVNECLVRQYIDSSINRLDADRLIGVKKHFLDKFEDDIDKFDDSTKNLIYFRHNFEIIRALLREKKYREFLRFYREIKEYKLLSYKNWALLLLEFLDGYLPIRSVKNSIFKIYNILIK